MIASHTFKVFLFVVIFTSEFMDFLKLRLIECCHALDLSASVSLKLCCHYFVMNTSPVSVAVSNDVTVNFLPDVWPAYTAIMQQENSFRGESLTLFTEVRKAYIFVWTLRSYKQLLLVDKYLSVTTQV